VTTSPSGVPRKGRWRWRRYVAGALLLAGGAGWLAVNNSAHILPFIPEQDLIRFERLQRFTYASFGWDWPGTPNFAALDSRLADSGVKLGAPVLIRIFKREFELEVWLKKGERFERFAIYPICKWSGRLGPKIRQGDRQAPEGFYTVDSKALNPNSRWFRSFNLGFPNTHDRAHRRTGSFIMVHGGCSSIGCYAMTNPAMAEIWKIVTAALDGGQKRIQVQVYPFRLTEGNLARRADAPEAAFWQSLKPGYDLFEATALPPRVSVCNKRYVFEAGTSASDGAGLETRCPARTAGIVAPRQ
jgi:murein L,D-transpeptidase YafK